VADAGFARAAADLTAAEQANRARCTVAAGEQARLGELAAVVTAQWSPANERIGRLVQELGSENVPVPAVVTDYQQATVYARQLDGGWQVVEKGIDLYALAAETAAVIHSLSDAG
jgi:hypothetical protein